MTHTDVLTAVPGLAENLAMSLSFVGSCLFVLREKYFRHSITWLSEQHSESQSVPIALCDGYFIYKVTSSREENKDLHVRSSWAGRRERFIIIRVTKQTVLGAT